MTERLLEGFRNWYVQDVLVALFLAVLVWVGWTLIRREYWRMVFRQVFRRRLVAVSFAILLLYALIALLDSVGYHPHLRDKTGAIRRDPRTGRALADPDGLSLLDVLLTPIRTAVEETYSAPLATHQFTLETRVNEKGERERVHPPLRYPRRHLLGTDKVGNDVLYLSLKSIRAGLILGGFTTLLVVPLAILFGVLAGYCGRWVDDLIQYVYTVLASIPSILLIMAFMVVFGRGLLQLCVAMGIISWTGLCRVVRGETMKLREMEFVQAAEAIGVPRFRIMIRHIVPNIMHIVLITAVLSFSGRVMAEAVLTYIGIGVGTHTMSWGIMINDALRELARDPVVWWKLFGAFVFMLGLVLPANLFGDALRDALDPRLRTR